MMDYENIAYLMDAIYEVKHNATTVYTWLDMLQEEYKLEIDSIMSSPRIDLEKEWISIRMD